MQPENQDPMVAGAILEGVADQMPKFTPEQMAWVLAAISTVHVTMRGEQTNPGLSAAVSMFAEICITKAGSGEEPILSVMHRKAEEILKRSNEDVQTRIRRAMIRLAKMRRAGEIPSQGRGPAPVQPTERG